MENWPIDWAAIPILVLKITLAVFVLVVLIDIAINLWLGER